MSGRQMLGVFQREEDVMRAVKELRSKGYSIVDVHTPYAIHGLDKAMGLKPSRLPWITFLLGLIGASLKVWFEYWTTGVSWPLDVGGKPWNSLPAFVPVTFEVMVLLAGTSTVLAFLLVAKLLPWRKPMLPHPRVTDNRFVLILDETNAAFEPERVRVFLEGLRAVEVHERIGEVAR